LDHLNFNLEHKSAVPSVLLTNTTWWPCASRLAIALTKAGCNVSAIYPRRGHPLAQTSVIQRRYAYAALHPVKSLAEAIRLSQPHLVVPCDDRAVQHLHELHAQANCFPGSDVCRLIERSLGNPASFPVVSTRYQLLKLALEEGLPAPDTDLVVAGQSLDSWSARHALPWVVKADGSWGGHGTKIVRDKNSAESFVRNMSRPLGAGRAVKRLVVDRDPFWILPWRNRSTPQVIIQSYVEGYPANCAVVCWDGKLLAGISVDVVCTQGETGSATVVRVTEGSDMMRTAKRLVERLGLSGFLGFDFVIEAATGTAHLIEMNPRVTPLCHLQLGTGRDLVSAITAQLTEQNLVPPPTTPNKMIAYFPQAWHWKGQEKILAASFHDIPVAEPGLVRELLRLPWPDRSILARLAAGVRGLLFSGRKTHQVVFQLAKATAEIAAEPPCADVNPRQPPAVVPLRQNGRKAPLFLIHGVDGQISRFYNLIRHLEPDQPVYGILAQPLLGDRVVLTRVEQLAAYYLKQVQSVQTSGPYHLLGFSYGGYVAFEVARQLHTRGELVGMVGMIDTLPMRGGLHPGELDQLPNESRGAPNSRASMAAFHAKRVLQSGGLSYAKEKLRTRGLRTIYTCLDSAGLGIPAFLRSAADLGWFAAVRYVPQPFPGKITLFHTVGSPAQARPNVGMWSGLTGRDVELHEIAGRHEDIFEDPQVKSLAVAVTTCLAKVQ